MRQAALCCADGRRCDRFNQGLRREKGTEIYSEKEPADYVYQVKSGAVRSCKLLSDGRRRSKRYRALSRLHELGILGFIGNNQRQIVLLDRRQLASLDLQN
jgi:hypothetical protein